MPDAKPNPAETQRVAQDLQKLALRLRSAGTNQAELARLAAEMQQLQLQMQALTNAVKVNGDAVQNTARRV